MKVVFIGPCLSGTLGRLEISDNRKLVLRYHDRFPLPINLSTETIGTKKHSLSIGKNLKVNVVEHLFSALYGLDMFHVQIDFRTKEVPFFDGSSKMFADFLGRFEPQKSLKSLRLNRQIIIRQGDSFIHYVPQRKDELIIKMELAHSYISPQEIVLNINRKNYINEIAPARTFVFTDEDDPRLQNLPAYGIGITKNGTYSSESLRFSNELVRHKILDLLGDLFVLKRRLSGRIIGRNTSHLLNLEFVRSLAEAI